MQVYAQHSGPLAAEASTRALAASGVEPSEITHLVTASCTGFDAPGVDLELIERLGLPVTTQRLNIGYMGCHGAINALRAARGLAASEPAARILICAVELCSLHFQSQWDSELMLGNALFADGSAAIVAAADAPANSAPCQVRATGSCLIRGTKEAMSWRVGDHGFEMSVSNRVPDIIRDNLRGWLTGWLDSHGHSLDSVGSWAVHPGGPRVLRAVEEALDLGPKALEVSWEVLSECGNMSSPTVVFILERLLSRPAPLPYIMLAFGPGLMVEAALIE
jgi:predicted naringenin-chalcone synthase